MIKKITVKVEFSNRTYLYEVEDGIDFFDAVRKASAEFVNTPDGRKIYYKKGSFSWLDFSLLFKNRKHKIFCHFREKHRNPNKIPSVIIPWQIRMIKKVNSNSLF